MAASWMTGPQLFASGARVAPLAKRRIRLQWRSARLCPAQTETAMAVLRAMAITAGMPEKKIRLAAMAVSPRAVSLTPRGREQETGRFTLWVATYCLLRL